MEEITSVEGHKIIIDNEDLPTISKYEWHTWKRNKNGNGTLYAFRKVKTKRTNGKYYTKKVFMHRDILHPSPTQQIHHKNANGLDNRKENLIKMTLHEHRKYHNKNPTKRGKAAKTKIPKLIQEQEIINNKKLPDWMNNPKLELW